MKIKQLRLMHGLSQKEFAQQFNLAQNTLSQYENEIRKPDIDLSERTPAYRGGSFLLQREQHH